MSSAANPLSVIQYRIPFLSILAEHVEPAVMVLLTGAQADIDAIAAETATPTYANTLGALEAATEKLEFAMGVVGHLESVATEPALRSAYNAVQPPVAEFSSGIPMNAALYARIRAFAGTAEAKALSPVKARFLKKTLDDFRRHGAELDDTGKQRLAKINVTLTTITTKFAQNVLDHMKEFEWVAAEEAALAGLPPSAVAAARQNAEAKGLAGWRFTLQQPSLLAVMTYLDDASIRERFYRAQNQVGAPEPYGNFALIEQIVALRAEKAALLGYGSFADLTLDDRMAHTGSRAMEFLQELEARSRAAFDRERAALQAFRDAREGDASKPLAPWDIAYYAEKLRQAEFAFDEEALRPYFPLPQVLEGMFSLVERLYGIHVRAAANPEIWDPAVKFYEIHDEDGALLGSFYTDWFPRENKRGGAWMNHFLTGGPSPGGFKPHLGLMCGNMTPPVGEQPALLTHREVETVFHEFGHLLHHCLSKVEVRSLAGTSVAWDFVELPSQIMENWCWERESLDLFARHVETAEPIPGNLFEKMRRARAFRAATFQVRQLGFGMVDLLLHTGAFPPRADEGLPAGIQAWAREIMSRYSPAPLPESFGMLASFLHLFSDPVGYAAGYYSYKWAEVLDADAFKCFKEAGVFSREVGHAFRSWILERGNSEDPAVLFRGFRGRDPDLTALLERQGLLNP
ncbi:MAG: M3 family metallopeptidase [Bryobacterales bacterium]|nr:M3 family metallopeptidase [Bryobacterales bacterium]